MRNSTCKRFLGTYWKCTKRHGGMHTLSLLQCEFTTISVKGLNDTNTKWFETLAWDLRLHLLMMRNIRNEREEATATKLHPHALNSFQMKELHVGCFGISSLPSPPFCSLFPGFYSAKADMVIYCGHPSLVLIHHRPVARRSWQQLFAFEFNRGAVSQRRQVKSITNTLLSHRIINQRQER